MAGKVLPSSSLVSAPKVKAFNCLSCGSTLQVRAQGQTQVVACSSCKTILDVTSEVISILSTFKNKRSRKMVIPLGARGKIHGSLWEVIGYMERSDLGHYSWSEYLLFNPLKGFRWLSENNGHWSYVLMTKERPRPGVGSEKVLYAGHYYDLFHKGLARIEFVEGEFYWKAKVGDKVEVLDFVRDSELLSMEKSDDETIWSVSEYLDASTVSVAFKVKEMPPQFGVAPNQPCPNSEKIKSVGKLWGFFVIALLAIQLLTLVTSKNRKIHEQIFRFEGPQSSQHMTAQFEVDDQLANVQVGLKAPVANSWLYVGGELVNVNGDDSEEFDVGVEFYSGYDDGYWTEGSYVGRKNIPSVRGGTYQLNFEVSGDKYPMNFEISVYRDVPLWKPFLWSLFFLTLWPVFLLWRRYSFNVQRWSDSDYSPYVTVEEE